MPTNDQDPIPPIPLPPVEAAPVVPTPPVAPPAPPYTPAPVYAPAQPAASVPPPPGQPAYAPAAYTPQAAGPAQGLSIASLVCGIASIVLFFILGIGAFLPALAAIITGHLAQKRQPHARGLWITGLITGYVGAALSIVGAIVGIIFLIALFTSTGMYFG